jgi:hypothetical protein
MQQTNGNGIEPERAFTGSLPCNMAINGNSIQGEMFGYIIRPYSSVTLMFRSLDGNTFGNIYLDSIHLRYVKNVLETGAHVNITFKKRIGNNIIPVQFVSDENFISFTSTDQRTGNNINVVLVKQDIASILSLKSIIDELLYIMTYIEPYFVKQKEQNQQTNIQPMNNNIVNNTPPVNTQPIPQPTPQQSIPQSNNIGSSPNPFMNNMNNGNGVI